MQLIVMPSWLKEKQILLGVLVVVLLFIFSGLLNNTFVIYDDPEYVTENVNILGGLTWKELQWAFTSFSNANWHPLTWLSHMLDVQLYGLNPVGHHVTSLLLHVANTVLLFTVLHRMSGALRQSFVAALLFGIHPLHVESVAWIAERKDVLSGFFFMATLWAYERHARRPGSARYWLVVVLFACGLMAKPMLVTLPLILLLLDYWPLRRINTCSPASETYPQQSTLPALLYEKIPLVILALVSSCITYFAQLRGGTTPLLNTASHGENISNGLFSYVIYIKKLLWPQNLAVFYPRSDVPSIHLALASITILVLSITAIMVRKKNPFVFVGWFWFVGTLVPVIGFIRIGSSAMSDRYTYIPAIGLFILLCWTFGAVATKRVNNKLLALLVIALCSVLSMLTVRQVQYWNNSFSLFQHALKVTDNNFVAYNNLGSAYLIWANNDQSLNLTRYLCSINGCQHDYNTRLACLNKSINASRAAIQLYPMYASAHFNLGVAYYEIGERQSAEIILTNLKYIDPLLSDKFRKYLYSKP